MIHHYLFLAALAAALFPLQGQTRLTGRVVDENDIPVKQARVIVKNAAGEVAQAATDPTGAFSVLLPLPGDYLLNVRAEGHFELRDRPIHVDNSSEITLTLNPLREVFQSMDVNGSPSPLDLEQTGQKTALSGTEINDIPFPSSHSLRNSMRLMPGVLQDPTGALHFEGAAENQVLYTLNGFNIGNPLTGRFQTRLAIEGIRSLEFWTGRYSPEFGKGSAGVLAIHTDSGADQFRYTVTNFVPGIDTRRGFYFGNWTPRFGVSGPIWRGRAWFADNFDAQYHQAFINGLPKGQDQQSGWGGSNLLHTQVNLTPSNILFADFLINNDVQNRAGLGPLDPVSTTTNQRGREYFVSVKDQMYFGHGMLVEFGYAHNHFFNRVIPQGDQPYIISPNGRSGNYWVNSTERTARDQFLADVFLPAFHAAGTHQFKVGTDFDRLGYSADFRRTAYEQIGLQGEVISKTTFLSNGSSFKLPNYEASSYVLDTWRLRRNLQLDLGVRQDWDRLVDRVSISPRMSVAYSPFASGRTRLSAGYAITYDATDLAVFARPLDQQSMLLRYNVDGSLAGPPSVTAFVIDNPHLKAPRSFNWSGGVDQELPHRILAGVHYLWRHGNNGFTYLATPDSIFHLTNFRSDAYHSTQISARQTFAGQYEWMASYTHSRAVSNAVLNLSIDQPLQVQENLGPLPWDSPNRFLASAYLPVPRTKNWAIPMLVDARTGFPFSITDETGRVIGPVDSRRFPSNFDLNLHVERRFTLHNYRFAIRVGFNNITDHLNPTAVNTVIGSPQYLHFLGFEGRHMVFRLRLFGRSRGN